MDALSNDVKKIIDEHSHQNIYKEVTNELIDKTRLVRSECDYFPFHSKHSYYRCPSCNEWSIEGDTYVSKMYACVDCRINFGIKKE